MIEKTLILLQKDHAIKYVQIKNQIKTPLKIIMSMFFRKAVRRALSSEIEGHFHFENSNIKSYIIGKIIVQVLPRLRSVCLVQAMHTCLYDNALQFLNIT